MTGQQMKENAKTMLWNYRDAIVERIELFKEGIWTLEQLLDSIKSGESYNYWVREYLGDEEE